MTIERLLLLFTLCLGLNTVLSQGALDSIDHDSPWLAPVINDEMTKDPEQNRLWRLGQNKYSAQPKHMWELGIHGGHMFISGDVDSKLPGGYGVGLHLRKALTYFTSIRFDGFYGQSKGLETQPWRHANFGGGLVENNDQFSGWESYNGSNNNATNWFPSYKTKYYYGAVQLIFNIGNVLFHKERNKWNTYVAIGAGLDNTSAGRGAIKNELETIYDGNYETEGFKKEGVFRIGDDFNIHAIFTASVGVSRKISKRFNIGIEHQIMLSDNDYLDGIKFRNFSDQSNNVDIPHYTNLRLGFNLGNFDKRIEPLYWVNPMESIVNDVAELKGRPRFEWIDNDNDGVLDLVDQELETPEGCLVDTKGITLDSDGDGVPDCKDKEPFGPPGRPVDAQGIAMVDSNTISNILSEEDVITIIKNNCGACQNSGYGVQTGQPGRDGATGTTGATGSTGQPGRDGNTYGTITNTGCGNWFLPMIHFDLDKYGLRPESYVSMHQVANVLKKCPEVCVTAHGHTDVRNSNAYNRVLSYKRAKEAVDYLVSVYGIDRSRLKLMYGGEESPLIPNLRRNHHTSEIEEYMQFINRRVEFRVCEASDFDMVRPDGPNAGKGSLGSSRPGSKYNQYKGNKNSGY